MRPNDMRLLVLAGLIAASPAVAATGGQAKLEKALAGKVAGKPVDCIRPDLSARPEIYDSAGIIYRDARITYVARMQGACPALREDRTVVVRGVGGQICRNDPVRIVESTGSTFGFCTFAGFTPYTK
jgi:hypothetical protein